MATKQPTETYTLTVRLELSRHDGGVSVRGEWSPEVPDVVTAVYLREVVIKSLHDDGAGRFVITPDAKPATKAPT